MIGLIRAHDLDRWGSRVVSPPEFPRLVRRLVHATGLKLKNVDFPADEAIRLAGWDGQVLADEGSPYVPEGFSVWELGTGKDPKDKADEDYEKRTADPRGVVMDQATFVFVTPRNWPGKTTWAESRRSESKWKNVIALDAENLAQWLESAPGVAVWLGPILGVIPDDAHGLEAKCDAYTSASRPTFDLAGLLIGRDAQRAKLLGLLQGPPAAIEISATTTVEGAAFVGACIKTLPEADQEATFSKAVWVDSDVGLRKLAATDRALIVLASGNLQGSPLPHHRVIVKTSRGSSPEAIELGTQTITQLVEHLATLGMDRNDAYQRCEEAGGYLERVRHTLLLVEPPPPAWASAPVSVSVAAAVLIGEWDERNEDDRAIVSAIAGIGYETFIRALTPHQSGPSPLMSHGGSIWKVYARATAWKRLEPVLTRQQLDAFLQAARDILLEGDPRFELSPEERWMADVHGKRRVHSNRLRAGLSAGLVHAAVLGRDDSACYSGNRAQSWIDNTCRAIFAKRGDPGFWRRIRDELRELAEASPDAFLSGLEADLVLARPQVLELFEEEGGVFGGCLHSDLLWALEILTWSPDFVGRAAMALAALAERDPGGSYANRPGSSLAEVLHPANPQCGLNAQQRTALFTKILSRNSKAGWNLGKALMPTGSMITSPTARPELRDWAPEKTSRLTIPPGYWAEVQGIAELLVAAAGKDVERWEFLLSNLRAFDPDLRERVLQGAESYGHGTAGEARLSYWTRLRVLLHHHNQFSSDEKVDWVYPRPILDRLEKLYASLAPSDPVARLGWLFSYQIGRPTNVARDWQEEEKRIDADRERAIEELFGIDLNVLVSALPHFQNSRLFGFWLGKSTRAPQIEKALLSRCANNAENLERDFARGFAASRNDAAPTEFLKRWCTKDSPDFLSARGAATVAQALNPSPIVWDLVEAAGTECRDAYWKEVPIHRFKEPSEAERAARNLLAADRALDAVDMLAVNLKPEWFQKGFEAELAVEVLKASVHESNARPRRQLDGYHAAQIIGVLAESRCLSPSDLMHLEWIYFGALEHQAQHKLTIYENLISDPGLLIELIELTYLPEGTPKEGRPEPTEGQKAAASQAWRLVHHWAPFNDVPSEKMRKADELLSFFERIRALAAEKRHVKIVDDKLGAALASSPLGVDGLWPHESIRAVLEHFGPNDEIADGFVVGRINLRGTTSRLPGDGGDQERDLAEKYSVWQRALAVSHPQTSRLLGRLAENYRSDGHHEDVQARTR